MKKIITILTLILALALMASLTALPAFAENAPEADTEAIEVEEEAKVTDSTTAKAVAAALTVAVVATASAIGMALAICKSTESMSRQPEAAGKINSAMMLGLVFIETVVIYALIVSILIIFVL